MDKSEIYKHYFNEFKKAAGVPWGGFPNEKIEKEYWDALQTCINTGVPLSKKQRKYLGLDLSGDVIV